jgi:hypothetical protein
MLSDAWRDAASLRLLKSLSNTSGASALFCSCAVGVIGAFLAFWRNGGWKGSRHAPSLLVFQLSQLRAAINVNRIAGAQSIV